MGRVVRRVSVLCSGTVRWGFGLCILVVVSCIMMSECWERGVCISAFGEKFSIGVVSSMVAGTDECGLDE